MPTNSQPTRGFPTVRIPSSSGGLPVEVCLVAQLGPGGGDFLIANASARQRRHRTFVEELDEPSAKLFGIDLAQADATSVYSFAVDASGHPFHRHAGHRVFTAISGSGGAHLRFSTLPDRALHADPQAFIDSLHGVDIPPDSLFTVRFGGGTWHQFAPRQAGSPHPVLFALSCHTNELQGINDSLLAADVAQDRGDIPSLTELLPAKVQHVLDAQRLDPSRIATTILSLQAPPESIVARACVHVRESVGNLMRRMSKFSRTAGYIGHYSHGKTAELNAAPAGSLLERQFRTGFDHEDMLVLTLPGDSTSRSAEHLLADVLEGFLANRPLTVSWLMQVRNALVKPLRLRTSALGCPVSSLLSPTCQGRFAGRYPVLDQQVCVEQGRAEVLLGADDRHLRFRSTVGVQRGEDGLRITLGTRVQCRNAFGRLYMALIERVHRRHVAPAMLEMAVAHALQGDALTFPAHPLACARPSQA